MIPHAGFLAGLDVRDSEVTVAVGEFTAGDLAVIGLGRAEIADSPDSFVRRPGPVTTAIMQALEEAELVSGVEITSVRLAMSGAFLSSVVVRGAAAVHARDRVVTERDERNAVAAAVASLSLPDSRSILQVQVQNFIVDGQDGIVYPAGLTALALLEANVLVVTRRRDVGDALIGCVRRAGRDVIDTVAAPLAAGTVLLGQDERELGAALLDINRDSVGIAVFERGSLRHLSAVHLTDSPGSVAVGEYVRAAIDASGFGECLRTSVVLAGSHATAPGLRDRIEQALDLPVVIGEPHLAGPWADSVDGLPFAAAFGLLVLGYPDHTPAEAVPPRLVDQRNWRG